MLSFLIWSAVKAGACGNKKAGRLCRVCFRPLGGGGLFICFLSFERLRLSPLPVVEVQNARFRVTRPPCCFAVLFCLVCPFRTAARGF